LANFAVSWPILLPGYSLNIVPFETEYCRTWADHLEADPTLDLSNVPEFQQDTHDAAEASNDLQES
jgi:hypothetical protein